MVKRNYCLAIWIQYSLLLDHQKVVARFPSLSTGIIFEKERIAFVFRISLTGKVFCLQNRHSVKLSFQ